MSDFGVQLAAEESTVDGLGSESSSGVPHHGNDNRPLLTVASLPGARHSTSLRQRLFGVGISVFCFTTYDGDLSGHLDPVPVETEARMLWGLSWVL